MTERTEEQIARDRAIVDSMKAAKSNMAAVLDRVDALERGLVAARSCINGLKNYIAPGAYVYLGAGSREQMKCTDSADLGVAAITAVLGR